MKKILSASMILIMLISLVVTFSACGESLFEDFKTNHAALNSNVENSDNNEFSSEILTSPDKYTHYIKNYVGKNCATLGYTSLGGDRLDKYGAAGIELIFVNADGTYVDIASKDALKEYSVVGQSIKPNTELKLVFKKDSKGVEYDTLLEWQSVEEIVLSVRKVGTQDESIELTTIKISPDKYTWYIADYVGRNLSNCGYTSLGGDRLDKYGAASVQIVIVTDDGSFVDPEDTESLKNYVVTKQSIKPNTELKLVFKKDSKGVEYDTLLEWQSVEEIELYVKRILN